ncbi:MAG: 2,3-dihydro-2,3-dihydroxybenzoate dehydrogenase [Bauldia sp.]
MSGDSGIAGKIALVTGAAGGIGTALVAALSAEGASIVAVDRSETGLAALAGRMRPTIQTRAVDLCDAAAVDALVESVEREIGPVEFGVSVAGILTTTTIVETTNEAWGEAFAVNAGAVFALGRALARGMIPRRRGSIVTVGSNAGAVPRQGMAAYAASKAAASMFTRCLGLELARYGIRCNVVAPGSTRTPMLDALWASGGSEEASVGGSLETFRNGIPLGRIAEPDAIADAIVFLLSDRARHITMQELIVDGGASLVG